MKIRKNVMLDEETLQIVEQSALRFDLSHSAFIRMILRKCDDYPKVLFAAKDDEAYFEAEDERVVVMRIHDRTGAYLDDSDESYKGTELEEEYAALDKYFWISFRRSLYEQRLTSAVVVSPLGHIRMTGDESQGQSLNGCLTDGDLIVLVGEFTVPPGDKHRAYSVFRYDGGLELVTYQVHG